MRNWTPSYHSQPPRGGLFHGRILRASPPAVLALGFLGLILLGSLLLWLPVSQQEPFSLFVAFFTATSAVTVTGLSIINPGTDLTTFGQLVLMLLIQLGGLGFVTFAVISAITMGKRMSLRQQALALEAFNQTSVAKIQSTAFGILKLSLGIELTISACLTVWWAQTMPLSTAAFHAVFHTVSAFNNAGFGLYSDSLGPFTADPSSLLLLGLAILIGGIGFTVVSELKQKRSWARLLPYTKTVLIFTAALNLGGMAIFWLLERGNPATLGQLDGLDQVLNAWFNSITARTAGFATLDVTLFHDSTTLLIMALMFIGGASLSTAGGIKIGTFAVLLAAGWSYIRHKPEVVLLRRSIAAETVQKALALLLVYSLATQKRSRVRYPETEFQVG